VDGPVVRVAFEMGYVCVFDGEAVVLRQGVEGPFDETRHLDGKRGGIEERRASAQSWCALNERGAIEDLKGGTDRVPAHGLGCVAAEMVLESVEGALQSSAAIIVEERPGHVAGGEDRVIVTTAPTLQPLK